MAFSKQEPNTFINIKLTNKGRKELALGRLNFAKAVISDREINYAFNRRYPNTSYFSNLNPPEAEYFNFCSSRVLEPSDKHPQTPTQNFDGSPAIDLTSKIFVTKQTITAQTQSTGMWSATTAASALTINDYIIHPDRYITSGTTTSADLTGGTTFLSSTSTMPTPGNLLLLRAVGPIGSEPDPSGNFSTHDLFYRITTVDSASSVITLERNVPYIDELSDDIYWFEYPYDGINSFYGSAVTVNCPVWNLNIVRTSREIGLKESAIGANSGQSYTTFASREYNGAKAYFGFDDNIRQVGFIHYTNKYTGNTYAEQLIPNTTEVDMPNIMWHRKEVNPGEGINSGHRFTDEGSNVYYDEVARTSYTLLKDGVATDAFVVGRVYFKLKLIVITDPELLTAMSYKSNRNYTLPPLILGSQSTPKAPLTTDNASGLLKSNYYYYVTYWTDNSRPYRSSAPYGSYGYQPAIHCGYVQKIEGYTDENGHSQFLTCAFPTRAFPYLRDIPGFTTYSGTGWSCNRVQILVQEVKKSEDRGVDALHPGRWSGASDVLSSGNGVFAANINGDPSSNTIQPTYLQAHQFIISQEDIETGATMPNYSSGATNNLYGLSSGFTTNTDYINNTGLTYGNESFFFGNITTKVAATVFKTVFSITMKDGQFNGSLNGGFDGTQDDSTYITEFGILNDENELVAVGKPTYPIKKNSSRYLTFQLEIDF